MSRHDDPKQPDNQDDARQDAANDRSSTATEHTSSGDRDKIVCRKTGKVMSWDEAHCPNKGKTCGYRAECQIPFIAEERDESD